MSVQEQSSLGAQAIEQAVLELNRIEHESGWGRVKAITEVLVRYGSEGGAKGVPRTSLRQLAAHPACPLSKSQLRDTLAAHRVYREEAIVRESTFLTPSHVAVVTTLSASDRRNLLQRAELHRLSVRELIEETRLVRRSRGERRGRPHTSRAEKAVTRFDNAVLFLEEAAELLQGATLPPELHARIAELIGRVRFLCDESVELVVEQRRADDVVSVRQARDLGYVGWPSPRVVPGPLPG